MAGGAGFLAGMNPLLAIPAVGAAAVYSRPGIGAINALSQMRAPQVGYSQLALPNGQSVPNFLTPLGSAQSQLQYQQRQVR